MKVVFFYKNKTFLHISMFIVLLVFLIDLLVLSEKYPHILNKF